MNEAKSLSATPWDFKARAFVSGMIYAVGFFVGINLQLNLFGDIHPTYVLLGERYGLVGIHVAAFLPVLFTLVALALRIWGTAYLSSGVVWNASVTSGGLLLSGPFRYVRNPLYLGNVFGAIGVGMIGPPLSMLIIVAGVVLFLLRLIRIEERYLGVVYGQAYRDYCRLVPRLLPRLRPALVATDPRPAAWADGFQGELFHLAIVIATLYNALFTWPQPTWSTWLVLLLALVVQTVIRRLAASKPAVAA
ncbi:MAG: isoprenylcysteine carboxylmethyltransferase family protein [Candidatus Eremiobacteraeota bacterium]|nr:isoprenylcysteine carboxylmethyltransferase family protein [Candidatus Eremiobacteraeota bacterium]